MTLMSLPVSHGLSAFSCQLASGRTLMPFLISQSRPMVAVCSVRRVVQGLGVADEYECWWHGG
jgi:hypothetical protein